MRHQLDRPIDERRHQDLADLRIGLDEPEELIAAQLNDVARLA
jgi:hypothetical protein